MKKTIFSILVIFLVSSCKRVAPNYYGVLMENYGKGGKADYHFQMGTVNKWGPGTELFQIPGWIQRGGVEKTLHIKASDNSEFTARPLYSYEVDKADGNKQQLESNVVNLVFQNSRLGSGEGFMKALEDNVLETGIYDIIKETSSSISTDSLMQKGGNLKFEVIIQNKVAKYFKDNGLKLKTFTSNLDYSDKVKKKIDSRNEVSSNVSVIDQKIIEQKKKNELADLEAQEMIIRSKGLTDAVLREKTIDKWNGILPAGTNSNALLNIK
jgi:hypothetical protein